ncbi:MAG: NAD(P)-dependent oxidoreductase [Caldilineaceae bacterium]
MRILITGASGFIGRHLVARLASVHEVYALVRRVPAETSANVRYIAQDLLQPLNRANLPDRLDAIIHQAAVIDTDAVSEETPFLVNVVATWRLLHYAQATDVRTFIYASTGGIYGCGPQPFREEDAPNPMDLYSLTKAQAELAVQAAPGDFHKVVLRYFFPYGVGTPNPIPNYVAKAVTGQTIELLDSGGPHFNPLHIADAVEATVRCLTFEQSCTLNIAGTERTTFGEIAQLAAQRVERQPVFRQIPVAAAIPYYRADLMADIGRMVRVLGFEPRIELADGIGELADNVAADQKRA